jgi:methylated-DNA-protein-cysteine methyltransferase-like protein
MTSSTYARIYRVVAKIPRGKVATYGQVAALAEMPRAARQVGYALAALRDDAKGVPWQRVINSKGEISARFEPGFEDLQRVLLEQEGVRFNAQGRVDLDKVQWTPGVESKRKPSKKKPARKSRATSKR